MLHPSAPRRKRSTSDEIARVAAQNIERVHAEDASVAATLISITTIVGGLVALAWALGL